MQIKQCKQSYSHRQRSWKQVLCLIFMTGNIKYFPAKSFVVTPREMIEIMNSNET